MEKIIPVVFEVGPLLFADSLLKHSSEEELINFIMYIDEHVADYDFTKKLRDKFSDIIAMCDGERP